MSQVKIYGRRRVLELVRQDVSDVVQSCLVDAFGLPNDKRFQRFIMLDDTDFIHPSDRSERYTIIEISCFEGRSAEAKKKLISLLYERCDRKLELAPADLEITIFETPRANWGIRGKPGDELKLSYDVDIS
jgi:phenylpyruvate tautomerase PptA (4-oxalocrotonate tautomerase family)